MKRSKRYAGLALAASLVLAPAAARAATVTIISGDPSGVGFNDTTPAAPVGGNTGITLGQQRMIAFQTAANKWGATLASNVTIRVTAVWTSLTCTSNSAILGSAGPTEIFRDFSGAPVGGHWYPKALANKLAGADQDSANVDISANFNINLGNSGCLTGVPFYLGLDDNHGSAVDLITVVTHELGHGLGFLTFTNGQTGAQLGGLPSIWDDFLLDNGTNKTWTMMSAAERVASAANTGHLVWNGGNVTAAIPQVLQPQGSSFVGADPQGRGLMYAPSSFQSGSSVSHFDTSMFRNQLMEPAINGDLTHEVTAPYDLTFALLKDLGWTAGTGSVPVLSLTKTHAGNFTQGQNGATYTLTVSNQAGAGATSGIVTVTDTVPTGLTLVSMAGTGWICPGNSCTRLDSLNGGLSYPVITVTVNVSPSAPSSVINQASVSGGNSATASASNTTVIAAVPGQVTLASPGNGAANQSKTPTLIWSASSNATSYDLYLGTSNPPALYAQSLTGASFTVSTALTGGVTYFWNVVAKNSVGSAPASGTWSFVTAAAVPGQVTLSAPANGAGNQSTTPTLSWSASSNATSYDLYLGTGNPPALYAQNLAGTSFTVTTALTAGSNYFWNVVAKNGAGSAPASNTSTFTTAVAAPVQVTLTSPGNGAANQLTTPILSWAASANATSYDLYLGASNPPAVYLQGLAGTSFTVSTPLTAGSTYFWNVVAKNSGGSAPASSTWAFTVAAGGSGCQAGSRVFTANTTWTLPGGCTSVILEAIGGGGGGQGGFVYQGGGGGGGGYSTATVTANPGTVYGVIVGAGGGGGAFSQASSAGGDSAVQLSGIDQVRGHGGSGGGGGIFSNSGIGGSGGAGTNPGGAGGNVGNFAGGGGGAGTSSGAGTNGTSTGVGGNFGGGAGGTVTPGNGTAGTAPGGGGGGGSTNPASYAGSGAAGGNGQVKITWSGTSGGAPSQVALASPATGATNQSTTPALIWSASSGATSYDLYLGTSNPPALYAQSLAGTSFTVSTALNAGSTYFWNVVAKNSAGSAPASVTSSFTTAAGVPAQAALTSPASGATNQSTTPTLTWSASSGATSYDLYVGTSNPPALYAQSLAGTSFSVSTALNAGSTYFWNVVAKNSVGSAPASITSSFTTAAAAPAQVTLTSPATGATSQSKAPTLTWSASSGATSYDLYLGTSNPPALYGQSLAGTSFTVSTALNAGSTYFWNVVAKNSSGSAAASATWSFTTVAGVPAQVTLTSPASGATNQSTTPTLTWTASSGATSYDLYLGTGNPPVLYAQSLAGTSFTVSAVLNAGSTYFWNVVAKNSSGSAAASATWSFTTASTTPGQVTLTSPGNGASGLPANPTLTWSVSGNATSYDLYLGTGNPPALYAQSLAGTSFTVSTALNAGSTYFWNVVAKNSGGSAPASATWSFTTAAGASSCQSGSRTFTTNATWTVPVGCGTVILEATGGGGGGQGGFVYQGAGGGGGGYSTATIAANAGTVYTVLVGAGGGGGAFSQASGAGGDSAVQLSGIDQVRGHGGGGGGGGIFSNSGIGGSGGAGASPGGAGGNVGGFGGGGGGAGTSTGPGTNGASSGAGGSFGGGAGGTVTPGNGGAGAAPGGGGGGGSTNPASYAGSGGAGGSGQVKITWSGGSGGSAPSQVTLTSPATASINQSTTPTLTWSASSGATSYDLYLGTSNPPAVYVQNLAGTSFAVSTALNAGTTYFWNLVAKNSSGSAAASSTWSFTTSAAPPAQVTLVSPATASINQSTTPSLTWSASSGATSYDLYLGTGNPPALYAQNLAGTSFAVSTALNAGTTYFWNVVAKNGSGSAAASSTWSFTTSAAAPAQATLVSPATASINQSTTPSLTWSASSGATSYDLYLGTGNPPALYVQNLAGTSFAVSTALNAGTTYFWNVVAKNGSGSAAASSTWSFTTAAAAVPAQVTLVSPATGAINQSTTPSLTWSASSGAASYDLSLGTGNPPALYAQNLAGTSFTVSAALNAGTTYFWNVVAKNGNGSAVASSTWSFSTAASGSNCQAGTRTFTANGTWTVPAGCASVILEAIGGGGGGQGGFVYQGAGGGGGGYSITTLSANPGMTYSVAVGAGGLGGAFSQASGAGGDSFIQLSGIDQVRGHGGSGGGGGIFGNGGLGGSGGAGSNPGGAGGNAGGFGGGGGGAGTSSSAGTNGASTGAGGSFGGGAGGTVTPGNGAAGIAPGGGGGGGATNPVSYAGSGGAGGNGQVRISWQ